ncbi:hypothetical protein PQR05_38465, partial [Paraburkholderia sediminicola]|uniref:hypothetical protein n=1 Tax=Paraburkholderia sediminicola TaxID=458836 RepID=UPI0038BA456D
MLVPGGQRGCTESGQRDNALEARAVFGHAKVRPHGVEKEFTSARSSQLCSSYTCAKEKRNNGPVAGGAGVVAGVRLDVRLQGDIRSRIKKQGYWFVIWPRCDHGKRRRRVALSD